MPTTPAGSPARSSTAATAAWTRPPRWSAAPTRSPAASPPMPRWATTTSSSATWLTTRPRCSPPSPAWPTCAARWNRCLRRRRPGEGGGHPGGAVNLPFGGLAAAAFLGGVAVGAVGVGASPGGYLHTYSRSVAPAPVAASPVTVEPPPVVVPDDSGIPGVVAWETRGWPASTGPAVPGALPHNHADGPIRYPVTPPAGGDHNSKWMTCGVYDEPVPNERAGHTRAHGVGWTTWRPGFPPAAVAR